MKTQSFPAALAVPLVALALFSAHAEDPAAAAAKKIFNENKDSVIWVSAVAKMSFSSADGKSLPFNIPEREQKFEALGTIIDASGLLVAALSNLDPTKDITGREINTPNGRMKIEASAILKEVRIILPDGTEVPADMVMKDADLDLAFVKPKPDSKEAKGVTFKAVDLKNSVAGNITDEVVTVSRMDEILNRQPAVQRGQIVAVTQKPRTFLRVSGAIPGCPTFALDGKLLGLSVNRSNKEKPPVTVVLPAADVLEDAEQAKSAKPIAAEEPKPKEAPKSDEKKDAPAK